MKISVKTANDIVEEINQAVNQPVNMMDENGIIIASTDPNRIGTEHVGARRIIKEKLECLTIYTDQEYSGSKVGINMPIYFRNEIVGVIGISGEWSQVSQYVTLIRKATELLLVDSYLHENADLMHSRRRSFLHSLLFDAQSVLPANFLETGKPLGINLDEPRRCVCISFAQGSRIYPKSIQQHLDVVEQVLEHWDGVLVYRELTQICTFVPKTKDAEILQFVQRLREKMTLPEHVVLKAGVDDEARIGLQLRICKQKAEKSICYAMGGSRNDIEFYAQMTGGLVLSEISHNAKKEFIQRIFPMMDQDEILTWAHILEVFYSCEGSITKAAEQLFIHKNTLQYQLKKLATQTGYDPRNIANAGLYQSAILFLHSM